MNPVEQHLRVIDGLFVGMLDPWELALFNRAVAAGTAIRSYEGAAGLLGVAKVRVTTLDRAIELAAEREV